MQSINGEATTGGTGTLCHNQPPSRAVNPGTGFQLIPSSHDNQRFQNQPPVSVAATKYTPQGQSSASTPTDVCTDSCEPAGSSGQGAFVVPLVQNPGLQAFSEPPRPRVLDQCVDAQGYHPGNYQQPQNGVFNQGGPQQQVYPDGQSVPRGYHSNPIPQNQQRSNDLNQPSSGPIVYQPEQNYHEPSYNTQGRPETHYPQSRTSFQEDPASASNQQVQYPRANMPSTYPPDHQQQYYDDGRNIGVDYQRQQDREYYYQQQQQQNQQGQYYGGENAHLNYENRPGYDYSYQQQHLDQSQPSQQTPSFEPPMRAPEKIAKATRRFVQDNDLEKGIDQDMEQAAAEVTAGTTEEGHNYQADQRFLQSMYSDDIHQQYYEDEKNVRPDLKERSKSSSLLTSPVDIRMSTPVMSVRTEKQAPGVCVVLVYCQMFVQKSGITIRPT